MQCQSYKSYTSKLHILKRSDSLGPEETSASKDFHEERALVKLKCESKKQDVRARTSSLIQWSHWKFRGKTISETFFYWDLKYGGTLLDKCVSIHYKPS